jgi:hypothetical protein
MKGTRCTAGQAPIKVLKMEDLSGEYNVDLAGNISMPLIGGSPGSQPVDADLDSRLTRNSARSI